tara:strand:+ start:4746 stop:5117 length:372 start_codon:yes stop_codon:yes gene_type:complete
MPNKILMKKRGLARRKKSIKGKLTIGKYPRLVVYRSNLHLYAQLVDDNKSETIISVSTNDKSVRDDLAKITSKVEKSKFVGKKIGSDIIKKKINKVMFDRNGYMYHGRVKAFVDAVRESGLNI